ncbi:hypothetical protein HY065_02565 [Candidatus Berkelbacteria bacterium]|nr:hypothetical protein [Candidatus Berkelbacteria bacterium]
MLKTLSKRTFKLPKPLLQEEGLVILRLEEYERFKEDLEMLGSLKFAKEIVEAEEDIQKGRVYSLSAVKKMFGL